MEDPYITNNNNSNFISNMNYNTNQTDVLIDMPQQHTTIDENDIRIADTPSITNRTLIQSSNIQNTIEAPSPNNNTNNTVGNDAPTIVRFPSLLRSLRRNCIFCLVYYTPIIISIITILAIEWKEASSCVYPLHRWLLIMGLYYVVSFLLTLKVFIGMPKLTDTTIMQRIRVNRIRRTYYFLRCMDIFWFAWFIIGIVWSYSPSSTCGSAYMMKRLCMALVFVHVAVIVFGCCACCCACCGVLVQVAEHLQNEEKPTGATKDEILVLKKETFDSESTTIAKEDANCAICLGDYENKEEIRYLPCNHHFHMECVDQWLEINKSCPFCKRLINGQEDKLKPTTTNSTSVINSNTIDLP